MSKPRETIVEQRLKSGALLLKTMTGDPAAPVRWSFSNCSGAARADVAEQLLSEGKLQPKNDGLFDDSQTFGLA